MLTILISIIVLSILFVLLNGFEDVVASVITGCIGGFIVGIVVGLIGASIVQATVDTVWRNTQDFELKQLQLDRAQEGSFFLGCGSVGGDDYYYYYIKYANGLIQLKRHGVSNCFIFESNQTRYKLQEEFPIEKHKKRSYLFGVPSTRKRHVFYIPEGSIKKQFKLNIDDK